VKTKIPRKSGFAIVEAWLVFIAAILISYMLVASFFAQKQFCSAQLRRIQAAKANFALWSGNTNSAYIVKSTDIYGPKKCPKLTCPAGGEYTIGAIGAKPACSISGHTL
jgi:hypothetical protein